jgi:translation elongation factor EF-4
MFQSISKLVIERVYHDRYQESDLVKLDLLLNGQAVDALASICHRTKAHHVGRELCEKLKKVLDRSASTAPS